MADKLKVEGVMELREVIARLEELTQGMRDGTVVARVDDEAVELRPSSIVAFELKAKRKHDAESFSLKLRWKRGS
jgi:amphi-Trp domain-containing protein